MYKRLESEMVLHNVTRKDLADAIGVQYNTILLKLRGVYGFTLDEAFKIKEFLKTDLPLDELFARVIEC